MSRFVVIHGSYGNPAGNWFPWLKHQLEKEGHSVTIPSFPTPDGQTLANWKDVFRSQFGELDYDTILIGHSVGVGFVLNLLNESSSRIKAAFLVAGFLGKLGLPEYDPINETFVCNSFDWKHVRSNAGTFLVMNGENDPYVPLERGREIANALGVPLHVVSNGGHLNADAGFTSFELLLREMRLLLSSVR